MHAEDLLPAGHIEFEFKGDPCLLDVHVFTVENFTGDPQETEGKQLRFHLLIHFIFIFISF